MKRLALAVVVLCLVVPWLLVAKDAPKPVQSVALGTHTFTLPPGFEIELVAGPPLVDRPITIDFDEQGRLYVTESSGTNEKSDIQLQKKPHRIVRLEDTNGDGKFDKRTIFAEGMMFPEGSLWYKGSLYVAAPPSIWKLTDTDGDGVADERVEWFKGQTLTGCANDLHGPYLGPDGWIYWCKGAFAKQTYERPGRPPFVTKASHIFRCRPDGTGIEAVMTGGMDNPVDVVFTPGGERIFTTTFLQRPGGGKRDGLIHAVYGAVYGKDHEPVYEHPWTSPTLMPPMTHLGPAAPCGLERYQSRVFGAEYQDNLFACLFNMRKVTRHILEPDGATFKTKDEDFVVSSNLDFHPTDVLEDADGSLLIVDTGGWYKLCCPTSQFHRPEILGGIYRVRKKDAARVADPRGLKLDWKTMTPKELTNLLSDERPAVQKRAMEALAAKGLEGLTSLGSVGRSPSADARRNAIWTATRIDNPTARYFVRAILTFGDGAVRQAALHSVSLWRDRDALPALRQILKTGKPQDQRVAAEAIGRIGDKTALPDLLEALKKPVDRFLEHSLIYALIELGDAKGLERTFHLAEGSAPVQRACLIALDQMPGSTLEAKTMAWVLSAKDAALKEAGVWIVSRHPEWGGDFVVYLRERLEAKNLTPAEREELVGQLARFARSEKVQELLTERLRDPDAGRLALRAMAQAGLKEAPDTWLIGLAQALSSNDPETLREAIATARALTLPKGKTAPYAAALLPLANNEKLPAVLRLQALAAVPVGLARVEPGHMGLLLSHLDADQPVAVRSVAADVLARSKLSAEQLQALTQKLAKVGPLELDRVLEAYLASTDEKVGSALLAALKTAPARSSLRIDAVRQRLTKYPASVQQQSEELYALLDADAAKQKAKLEELLSSLESGDVQRGRAVFHSTKAACVACHALGYLGGTIGPDLTKIGGIRTERDLLEAIVFPSASFVRSYEPVQVTTKAGKVVNGVIRKDAADEIALAINATEEVRLRRDEIEEIVPSKVSIMPAGLDQQLTRQELADLVAFLRACK